MAHRVARGLVGGCALLLLLGVAVAGCAAPQYTYVANSGQNTYFKVPAAWHKISDAALSSVLKAAGGGGGWAVAYEAGGNPTAKDFLGFDVSHPFVFAEIGQLSPDESSALSYNVLRDFFLPVTASDRQQYSATPGYPLSNFSQSRDEVLTPGQGVHGVRETFNYTFADGASDTFDEIVLTNAVQTVVYLLVLHCTTSCYSSNQTQINDVMSSFTVRSP